MRAADCHCGEHLEARTDAALLEELKRHSAEEHDSRDSEADLKTLVNTQAYDTGD